MLIPSRISKVVCTGVLLAAAIHRSYAQLGDSGARSVGVRDRGTEEAIDTSSSEGTISLMDGPSSSGSDRGPPADTSSSSSTGVLCDMKGGSADYQEVLSGNGVTMMRNVSTSTGCPNHVNWPLNPNQIMENPLSAKIPAYPMLMDTDEGTDLSEATSPTGMMLNGVALFSSWGRVKVVSYDTTAFVIEGSSLDLCAGHANPNGMYHYHCTPGCLQEHAMTVGGITEDEHSPQLGWSYDGFPVYGQLGPNGTEMKMCGMDGAHDTYCLDWCSGYEGETEVDDFKYRYYLSCGANETFFPFTTNCYRGCCPQDMECDGTHVEACGSNVVEGYMDAYVPSTGTPLTEPYDTNLIDGEDTDHVGTQNAMDCSLYLGAWNKSEASEDDSTTSGNDATPSPTASSTLGENEATPLPTASATVGGINATPSPTASSTLGENEATPLPTASPTVGGTNAVSSPTPSPTVSEINTTPWPTAGPSVSEINTTLRPTAGPTVTDINTTPRPTASPTLGENSIMAPANSPTPVPTSNGSDTESSAAIRFAGSPPYVGTPASVLATFAGGLIACLFF